MVSRFPAWDKTNFFGSTKWGIYIVGCETRLCRYGAQARSKDQIRLVNSSYTIVARVHGFA